MLADWLLYLMAAYSVVGLGFSLPFVAKGVSRIDPAARLSRWGFRAVILPGAAALWPLLLMRWWRGRQ